MIRVDYSNEPKRDILCIDIKSFFASVEAVERGIDPRSAYIVVMSRPESDGGLVLAASPKVKKEFGITTGSRRFEIPKHSPIQIVEPRMGLYLQKNAEVIKIFKQFVSDDDLHIYSIDESFLDVTKSHALYGKTSEIAKKIQQKIWRELGFISTVGIGDNPLLAKLALDNDAKHSPHKGYRAYWHYGNVQETIWKIAPITDMWGIGNRTKNRLHMFGIDSVFDLSQYDYSKLKNHFGIIGEQMFYHAHGVDRSVIAEKYHPLSNSYSKNQVLEHDYTNILEIKIIIQEMTDQVGARLREHHAEAGLIHLSIGYSKDVAERGFSRQMTVIPTNRSKKLISHANQLFDKYYDGQPVRTINISCGKISYKSNIQFDLFEDPEDTIADIKLDHVIDTVRSRYGYTSLVHASSIMDGATAIKRSGLIGGHKGW